MRGMVPHTNTANWPTIAPDRFVSTFRTDSPEGCAVALLGLPDDTGVRLNNGRAGAAHGPAAFRAALARYGTAFDAGHRRAIPVNVFDAGDVMPSGGSGRTPGEAELHETHRRVTDACAALHQLGLTVVCVGGGHDLTFPAVRAMAGHAAGMVGGINFDAHLDVRETVGSGMPYRALIEGGFLDGKRFVEYGISRFASVREHVEFLLLRHATIVTNDEARADEAGSVERALAAARGDDAASPMFVSIDLDGIDGASAPGVSAVNPAGLSVHHAAAMAGAAGREPRVRHFDIMELNPVHDDPAWDAKAQTPGRTARIAAHLFMAFVAAVGGRADQ
ncbi:MAG TPA: formimidoylglutamase [Phycisphaerales bacterium]|nr:formimidoylglutamase [Phycisphaerales bacterium]